MKKLLVIILILLFTTPTALASPCPLPDAITDVDISFSSFEWYSDYPTVVDHAEEMDWGKYSDWFSRGGCTTPHWTLFKEVANSYAGSESNCGGSLLYYHVPNVAGYEDVTAQMFFIFNPGVGNYDNYSYTDSMQFYLGEYEFTPADLEACYEDLRQKLASIYGNTAYLGSNGSLTKDYTYWVNQDGAVVGIGQSSTDVIITYSAPGSEEKLAEIEEWIAKDEIAKAKGDTSGL